MDLIQFFRMIIPYAFLLAIFMQWSIQASSSSLASDENTVSCQGFTADRIIRDLISSGHATAEPCPCIEQIIAIDETFEKISNCYKQWFFMDGVKQMCCYSEYGQLLIDSPGAGYLLLESFEGYIERAHDICCGNGSDAFKESCESFYQINKPDNCSTYVPPVVSISSGDPVIQTIDGGKYDFNGHGEYVFLTDGNYFEIQARTEYVVPGNSDSTYFSAFALLDKTNITSHEQIQLHYDKKTKDIIYSRNGTYNSNCSASSMLVHGRPYPCELPPRHNCFVLAGGGKIIIQNCGFKSYIKQLVFGNDNFLGVQIIRDTKANITNITGLAGHREDGFYITRNNTEVSENASSLSVFLFAESWSLQNESESVFMYDETCENFTTYNNYHTRPEFLEDKLGNLTALFESFTQDNITLFNNTCINYWNKEPNNQCLLTIARTRDYDLGLKVMNETNATRHKWEILHNKAPNVSSDFPDKITVSINSTWTINLTDYVTDDHTPPENLVFDVVTNLTKEEYSIDNGEFTWNVGIGLRKNNTGIKFIVYDILNASSVFNFSINYCGCSEISFCLFNQSTDNPSDTVVKAPCNCPKYLSGLFCEDIINNCPRYHCHSDCNATVYQAMPSWPCSPCPKGMEHSMPGFNQTCTDIDECDVDYSGHSDKCEQICTNTDGSFKCSCSNGYELNRDGHSCDDIDECNQGLSHCHGKNEACVNTPGHYKCICVPGYYNVSGGVCEKMNGPEFVGTFAFVIDTAPSDKARKEINKPENQQKMQQKLEVMFKSSPNFESVEVIQLRFIEKRRRKRQDSLKGYTLQVDYIVHCQNKTEYTFMQKDLQDSVKNYTEYTKNDTKIELGEVTLNLQHAELKVNNAKQGGRCTVPGKTDCAKDSTNCNDYDDGTFNCTCKIGYKPSFANVEYKYCNDIDECEEFKAKKTLEERCIHGVCRNSIGSWNCICNPDRLWQNIGNYSYPVYRCQGNYSYIGNISVADHDPSKKANIVEFIQNQLKTFYEDPNNENNSYAVPMSSLFVNATVLSLFKNISHSSFRQYNVTFLLRIGEIVESGRLFNVLKKVLSQGDYRTNTSSLVFENNSYVIFNDSDNKLCAFGSNGNCDKVTTTCRQKDGSTLCDCMEGFNKTSVSMKYCTDIDECDIEGTCNNETCLNSFGNWSCKCKNDYSIPVSTDKDNFSCKDVSVCEYTNMDFKCNNGNRTCRSDTQKWECTCQKGFSPVYKDINTLECEDANECAGTGDKCSGHGTCKNILNGKGYSCNCEKGYRENATNYFNVTCEDIDECKENKNCSGYGSCVNYPGRFECKCNDGFMFNSLNQTCIDIDECQENKNCSGHGSCINYPGKFECKCYHGFVFNRSSQTCIDVDECKDNKNCSGHGSCVNYPGRFECKCYDGFVLNYSNQTCIDVDECKDNKNCSGHGSCVNYPGRFECKCNDGFMFNSSNQTCIDINECTNKSYYCGGDCKNTLGSWTCDCEEGYSKESNNETNISCEDINECDTSAKCVDGVCINQDGSWSCYCQDGKQPERKNSTLTVCRGGFQYIMSTGISVSTSSDIKPNEINIYMKAQIEEIYRKKFQNQDVRVEIISVIRVDSGKRRKRQATDSYEINFVLHFHESIPHKNISQAWTEYIKDNCVTKGNVVCPSPKNLRALPVVIEDKINITKDQSAALCNLDKYNHCDPDTSTCHFVNGSANCDCKKGYTKNEKQSNLTCEVSKDACQQSLCKNSGTCRMSEGNKSFECLCRDGWTGKYCEDVQVSKTGIQVSKTDDKTILIATTSSLGGLVIILALAMIILCRFKSKKSDDDKMSLKHMDTNGFKSFDGALHRNRFVEDDDDGVGSYYSRRLSSSSLPYGHQHRLSGSGNQNGFAHNGFYASPNKLPRANIHGSMPNLAGNGTSFNHFDDRRYSGDEARHVLSYNQGLNRSYDIDLRAPRNNWNGRRSPPPDYGRPRSPKPDYHGRKFNRSKDSGVGNGNSSESNEYQRQENRGRHYYYGQRQSTNF